MAPLLTCKAYHPVSEQERHTAGPARHVSLDVAPGGTGACPIPDPFPGVGIMCI